jgi:hypothetical protein
MDNMHEFAHPAHIVASYASQVVRSDTNGLD